MHKIFYASGFLYHLPTQQILLQQSQEENPQLSLISGKSVASEDAISTFQRTIFKQLYIELTAKSITTIYDYFHEELKAMHYVFYAKVNSKMLKHIAKSEINVAWFPLKMISKLTIQNQARQDILVGTRVINLMERQKLEKINNMVELNLVNKG